MSWYKKTNISLTEEGVEEILDAISAEGPFSLERSRQKWGWSCECDIQLYIGKVEFSGAEFSRGCSLPRRFIEEANKRIGVSA